MPIDKAGIEIPEPFYQFLAAVHLCSLYHHLVDTCQWPKFTAVFASDSEFTTFKGTVYRGPDEISEMLKRGSQSKNWPRAVAHHSTDVFLVRFETYVAEVESKYFAILSDGTAVSGFYKDTISRVEEGWRIMSRVPKRLVGVNGER